MLPGSLAPFSEGMVGGVAGLVDVHGIGGAFFGVPRGRPFFDVSPLYFCKKGLLSFSLLKRCHHVYHY